MLTLRNKYTAATLIVAVMFMGLGLSGCCTKRQLDELGAEVRDLKTQNLTTQQIVARMDSTIVAGADANNKLRNDVSITVSDLQRQMDMLLENYNQLLAQIQQLNLQPVTHVIRSSPGAQEPTSATVTQEEPGTQTQAPVEPPRIDCGAAYDESFILVRQGEYDRAIENFDNYIAQCPGHESVEFAYYWLGECYYAQEKYVDAINMFEYLLENYKSSVKASSALYKVGRSQQELGKVDQAKATYQRVIDDYPGSLEDSQARERLKDLQ
ncbi:MAG: tol-pal system protein YbgF [Candidatus Zixiibacteriota bacterium]|nr:MAG: tol-pal system protein YbgF [candidate division Zixibacteria bacterium]